MAKVEVRKTWEGFWHIKGFDFEKKGDEYINNYYSGFRFRDQPEVVLYALNNIEGLDQHIDREYYERWVNRLDRSESIKKKNDFSFSHNFKMPPYKHQQKALKFMLNIPSAALFMEPGTGKTYVALVGTEIRKTHGLAKKTLVAAPASIIYTGWYKDCLKFTDLKPILIRNKKFGWVNPNTGTRHMDYDIAVRNGAEDPHFLLQNERKTLEEKLSDGYDIYISSIDHIHANIDAYLAAGFDSIIVDESTMIKNPSGKMFASLRRLRNAPECKYSLIMTGTPTPNGIEDLWSQMKFLDNSLDDTIGKFRERYFTYPNPIKYPWLKNEKRGAKKDVAKRVRDRCLYIRKDDCLDLPDRVTVIREVEPTSKIKKAYEKFRKELYIKVQDEHFLAQNVFGEILRLHQLLQGHIGSGDETKILDKPKKLSEVQEIVDGTKDKVVIWARYKQDFKWLKEQFEDACVINGDTRDAGAESERFLDKNGPKVMIAHPQSAKFGHTWNCAKTSIFYSYGYSLEDYLQARDRNYRIGQEDKVTEYILTSGGIEDEMVGAITNKRDMAQKMLDSINEVLNLARL